MEGYALAVGRTAAPVVGCAEGEGVGGGAQIGHVVWVAMEGEAGYIIWSTELKRDKASGAHDFPRHRMR